MAFDNNFNSIHMDKFLRNGLNNTMYETQRPPPRANGISVSYNAETANPPAVQVIKACKSYTNGSPVLVNLDMNVPQGSIYGLLGASGCGKTSILSCIVGIRKLDSGDIFVFGEKPGSPESGIPGRRLGYMPQDIALYKELTIREMLQYFGTIYTMTNAEIESRIQFLSNFLDLPESKRRIANLSGGQMRRTSLAVCLLHEPELLILDEPTVGVDPLLRTTIWNHLSDLVRRKGTTVIITTHYIEECREANTIGILRNGKLLVEKPPDLLLKEFKTPLLEDIVLKLCRKDDTKPDETFNERTVNHVIVHNSFYNKNAEEIIPENVMGLKYTRNGIDDCSVSNPSRKDSSQVNWSKRPLTKRKSLTEKTYYDVKGGYGRIRALATRNALYLLRTPLFMAAIFLMPSFQIIITNLTLGPEPKGLQFGIVNPEVNYDLGKCLNSPLNECPASSKDFLSSCEYIKSIPKDILIPVAVNSTEKALSEVELGNLWGYMEFPTNYTKYLLDRAAANIFSDNETLKGSNIAFRMDHSNYFASALLMKNFYESFHRFLVKSFQSCNEDVRKADLPLNFRPPIYGTFEVSFNEYIGPAVLTVILFFIPYLSCAVYNISDRKQGTLERSLVAGVKWHDLLAAFLCTEGVLIIIQTLIAYLLVLFIFQMEIKGSAFAFLLITVMVGAAGLSLGFLIAQLVEEEIEALILGVGFYLPNLIFCGIIWPLEAAPWIIRVTSYCLPMTWAIQAIRSIISRGWSVTHRYVWPGYAVLAIWILSTWALAAFAFKRRIK